MWKITLSFWHGIGGKQKPQDHHHPMALPSYLAQRDAKRHSKSAVLIVIKFFKLPILREKLKGAKGQYPPAHHQIPRLLILCASRARGILISGKQNSPFVSHFILHRFFYCQILSCN